MKKLVQWGTMGIAAILWTSSAPAATVYVTGFENSEVPPFTLGNLNSQNGWIATPSDVQVTTSFPQTGLQGVFSTGVNDSFSRAFSVNGSPTVSVAAGLDYVSGPEAFTFGLSGTGGVVASVRLNSNGSLTFSNGTTTAANTFSVGNYNNYLLTANYATNTYDFSLNSGFFNLTGIPFAVAGGGTFSGVSVVGSGGFGVSNNSNNQQQQSTRNINGKYIYVYIISLYLYFYTYLLYYIIIYLYRSMSPEI